MRFVLIPFRDKADLTCSLIKQLGNESYLLYDNGSAPSSRDEILRVARDHSEQVIYVDSAEMSLTRMWNAGWDAALELGGDDVEVDLAILNNDLNVPEGFLDRMSQELRGDSSLWLVCPDWTAGNVPINEPGPVEHVTGTFRHGGVCGWAFMVKAEARRNGLEPIDEQFQWWGGDGDLVFSIEAAGHTCGRIGGLGIEHIGSQTMEERKDIWDQAFDDLERVIKKWGR